MFTGLIEGTGRIVERSGARLAVRADFAFEAKRGDSISVNGCCLTLVRDVSDGTLEFFTLGETLGRTSLGALPVGAKVNLERALSVGSRLDGHLVQGHVDAALKVLSLARTATGDTEMQIELPPEFAALVVEKGSVAVDGVSLTVAALTERTFSVCLIPRTLADTVLGSRTAGTKVNLEGDIIGKYVRRFFELSRSSSGGKAESSSGSITYEKLREAGFL